MSNFWPGTKIVKSTNNGFNLRPIEAKKEPTPAAKARAIRVADKQKTARAALNKNFTATGAYKQAGPKLTTPKVGHSITIGKPEDQQKRRNMARASI